MVQRRLGKISCKSELKLIFFCYILVVEVSLIPLNGSVSENDTFRVCVNVTAGVLGCNITVPLVVQNGSALGELVYL